MYTEICNKSFNPAYNNTTVFKEGVFYMIIHVVKSGESIYSIASQYGVTPESIIQNNQLNEADNLVIGQTIVIITGENIPKTKTIAVNGYAYPNIDRGVLYETLPDLSFITLFTYGFTPEGELVTIDDDEVIEAARSYGTAPLMLISTLSPSGVFSNELAHTLLNNNETQDILINNILNNMRSKNYYGLDVDFEYILPEDRQNYINFISKLTATLNDEGYLVMVALAPKISADQPGLLYEAHDYGALGAAANAVLLMTYEWGYTYGPPMAVAPIPNVRRVLDYAVTEIPRNKIFMGIPNYGYDWTLPYVKGSRARSISNVGAVDLAREVGAEIKYDYNAESPYFNYYDSDGNEHVVWFEDARSIQAKLELVEEYDFVGVSYWNIMKYFPQNWLVLNSMFNIFRPYNQ